MIINRYDYLDLFKCIAMFMVISLHSLLWQTDLISNNSVFSLIQWCLRLIMEGVPIFIFVNGFLIIGKENLDYKKHYKKVLKLFLLFILWAVISYCLISWFYHSWIYFDGIIDNIISINANTPYTGHLWFIKKLLFLYLIYPLINNIYNKNKTLYNSILIIIMIITFIPSIINLIVPNNIIYTFMNKYIPANYLIFAFYFMLGGFVKNNIEWFKKRRTIIIVISIIMYILSCLIGIYKSYNNNITYTDNYLYYQIMFVFIVIGILMIIINYKNSNQKYNIIIQSISENSFGIYLIHPIVLAMLTNVPIINYNSFFFVRLINCIIIYVLSYLITLLIRKTLKINTIIKV